MWLIWVGVVVGAVGGLECGVTLGAVVRGEPSAARELRRTKPRTGPGSLDSLRAAFARMVLAQGRAAEETSEETSEDPATDFDGGDAAAKDDDDAVTDEDAEGSQEAGVASGGDLYPGLLPATRWRSPPFCPAYWYGIRYGWRPSWGEEDDGVTDSMETWVFPGKPPETDPKSKSETTRACPSASQTLTIRLQRALDATAPGVGLVCLTGAPVDDPRAERLSLLRSVVRSIESTTPMPELTALLVYGRTLGLLAPSEATMEPSELAASLQALGLTAPNERAVSVLGAFQRHLDEPTPADEVERIDGELSLVVASTTHLARLLASHRNGAALRGTLGIEPSPSPPATALPASLGAIAPTLDTNTELDVEFADCPQSRRATAAGRWANTVICVGDGGLAGGPRGPAVTTFYEDASADETT